MYGFDVVVAYLHQARSGPLRFQDWIELEVVDATGAAVARAAYDLELSTGEVRRGTTDAAGRLREERVPPGGRRLTRVRPRPSRR